MLQTPWAGGGRARLGRRGHWGGDRPRETATAGDALRWGRGSVGGAGSPGEHRGPGKPAGRPPSPSARAHAHAAGRQAQLPGVARGRAAPPERVTQHRLTGWGRGDARRTAGHAASPSCGPARGAGGGARGLGDSILRVSSPGRPRSSNVPPRSLPPRSPRDSEEEGLSPGFRSEIGGGGGRGDPRWGEG